VLGVPVGSSVDFPNDDPIFHNVFSLSGPQPFDLGLYRRGQAPSRTFAQPGTYRVFCNRRTSRSPRPTAGSCSICRPGDTG
jgi:plastocyanin